MGNGPPCCLKQRISPYHLFCEKGPGEEIEMQQEGANTRDMNQMVRILAYRTPSTGLTYQLAQQYYNGII